MYDKVAEIAKRYRVSRDAVYAWIRQGVIPDQCLVRLGNSIRVDSDAFEKLMPKLWRPRRVIQRLEIPEDQVTVCLTGRAYGHRWTDESGSVAERRQATMGVFSCDE